MECDVNAVPMLGVVSREILQLLGLTVAERFQPHLSDSGFLVGRGKKKPGVVILLKVSLRGTLRELRMGS